MMMMTERYDETAEGCYTHTPLNYDVMYNDINMWPVMGVMLQQQMFQ